MTLYTLFADGQMKMEDAGDIFSAPSADTSQELLTSLRDGHRYICSLAVDDIVEFFHELALSWAERGGSVQQRFASLGLNFLLYWFRETHLRQALDISMRGNRKVLDDFAEIPNLQYQLRALPRGIVCHWLAGNVPMLGMLSLVQGMLTKNMNLLKVPQETGHVIPSLLSSFNEIVYRNEEGRSIWGSELVKSVAAVYVESGDMRAQEELSWHADVRVAWGGLDAVEAVINLPHRYGCDDIVFGPKTSFMVVGREFLDSAENARTIARRASLDASLFDQQGCNSPHTVFVEHGGALSPELFAQLLADEMGETAKRYPRQDVAAADTMTVQSLRAEYDMRGEAFYPDDLEWTVVYSDEDTGLATPCYNRTLFVRPVGDLAEVEPYCSRITQTVGVAASPERRKSLANRLMARGVDRCPEIGSMTLYEVPWDGMFAMDRMVRWCKL